MDAEGNHTPMENTLPSDQPETGDEVHNSGNLTTVENAIEYSDDMTVNVQMGDPALEIVVDGLDLANATDGGNELEISIKFEKDSEQAGEGSEAEFVNRLDGLEVKVHMDETQEIDVQVVSADNRDAEALGDQEMPLAVEAPQNEEESKTPENGRIFEECSNDKKRSRDGVEDDPRCLKPKTEEVDTMDMAEPSNSGVNVPNTESADLDKDKVAEKTDGVTTTEEDKKDKSTENENVGRSRPRKRRKIAMILAYCGAGFQGMQKNPGAITIEGELEKALVLAGAMPDDFDGNPRKVDWMRAARTDKGVSAVGNVVSGFFYIDPPGFVERVNLHLPKQIRLFGFKRVTPSFSSKKFCDRRRYEYVIPLFALDPSTHRDRESVLASEGKEDAFVKCLECCERGRKIPVWKARNIEDNDGDAVAQIKKAEDLATGDKTMEPEENEVEEPLAKEVETEQPRKERTFCFGEAERKKLNSILNHYVGTHNFHNFTSKVKAEDPSAKRYIVSFEAGDVFTIANTDFVRCTVIGQSFMLHQIRKMIGLAIAVFRGCAPESMLDMSLRRDVNITIPTAPELGLFLDECLYPAYNQKWSESHEEISLKGFEEEVRCFKHEIIYEHIAATEQKEGQMALFLHSLNDRNYAGFAIAREADKGLDKTAITTEVDKGLDMVAVATEADKGLDKTLVASEADQVPEKTATS